MSKEFDPVAATKALKEYWETYDTQHGYENYNVDTFIEDALYGIGIAIDEDKYGWGNGLRKFKRFLQKRWFKEKLEGKNTT